MSSAVKAKTSRPDFSKVKKLFGTTPVLSSESLKGYNAVWDGFMEAIQPDDFVLAMLVTDLADQTWEMKRCKRQRVLLAESERIQKERAAAKWADESRLAEMVAQATDEFEQFKALRSGIKYYEQLDRLQAIATAQRNEMLALIEVYRQGLGQRARQASDEIIEVEFQETSAEAPSIAGPDDGAE